MRWIFAPKGAWAAYAPAFMVFALLALHDIGVPGLYMDAVNPDYLAVTILHRHTGLAAWVIPGNALFGTMPDLIQIYYGALPLYVGLPIYALLGTGMVGIRVANMVFGLIVLLACATFLRAFRVRDIIGGACLLALAIDPGFLFCWRTQFYIVIFPVALSLASVSAIQFKRGSPDWRVAAFGGFAASFAVYGYFIYLFLVPACAIFAVIAWRDKPNRRMLYGWWVAGFAVGASPYLVGLLLIADALGGLSAAVHYVRDDMSTLHIAAALSLSGRAALFVTTVRQTLLGVGPSMMLLKVPLPTDFAFAKFGLLLAVPALGVAAAVAQIRGTTQARGLLVLTGFVIGDATLYLVFGNRLWLHHAAFVLPVLYLALAFTLDLLTARWFSHGRIPALALSGLAATTLFLVNAGGCAAMFQGLDRTGGVGLASNAIERFAAQAKAVPAPTSAFFPDWGVFMPFEMITQGNIPVSVEFSPAAARSTLCSGRDVLTALLDPAKPDRLQGWIKEIGWGQPDVQVFSQYDGPAVLTAVRWRAHASAHGPC